LPEPPSQPEKFEYNEEAAPLYEEQLYCEDYWDRNADYQSATREPLKRKMARTPTDAQ
jgi:hypothetical protein